MPIIYDPAIDPKALPALQRCELLLDKVLTFGSKTLEEAFATCTSAKTEYDGTTKTVPLFQFRWSLELIGGIKAQVKHSAIPAADVVVRSLFESALQYEYFLAADSQRRVYSYLYWDKKRHEKHLVALDSTTQQGKQLQAAIKKDSFLGECELQDRPGLAGELRKTRDTLEAFPFRDIADEFRRSAAAGGRVPEWYSLFDGPRSMEQLATVLSHGAQYHMLYRAWSRSVHSNQILAGFMLTKAVDGGLTEVGMKQIMRPVDVQSVTSFTVNLGLRLISLTYAHYFPLRSAEWSAWYSSQIKVEYFSLPIVREHSEGA